MPKTVSAVNSNPAVQKTNRARNVLGRIIKAFRRDAVACAANGLDEFGFKRVIDTTAEIANIDVNDIGLIGGVEAPDVSGDVGTREYPVCAMQHVFQNRKCLGGQLDVPASASHAMGSSVHTKVRQL